MTSDLGVTGPQRLALRVVGLFPGMSAGNLCCSGSTMLRLTTRGTLVYATTQGTIEAAIGKALDDVTGRDRAATRRVLVGALLAARPAGFHRASRRW